MFQTLPCLALLYLLDECHPVPDSSRQLRSSDTVACVVPTGAALHDNNDASEKVTTQYGRQ